MIAVFLRALVLRPAAVPAENLALRQKLGVLKRSVDRPQLRKRDRIFWVWLSRIWTDWRSCLLIVKPETVIRWHREGFQLYWRCESRKTPGHRTTAAEPRPGHRDPPGRRIASSLHACRVTRRAIPTVFGLHSRVTRSA
jgi:hypothetical protein